MCVFVARLPQVSAQQPIMSVDHVVTCSCSLFFSSAAVLTHQCYCANVITCCNKNSEESSESIGPSPSFCPARRRLVLLVPPSGSSLRRRCCSFPVALDIRTPVLVFSVLCWHQMSVLNLSSFSFRLLCRFPVFVSALCRLSLASTLCVLNLSSLSKTTVNRGGNAL